MNLVVPSNSATLTVDKQRLVCDNNYVFNAHPHTVSAIVQSIFSNMSINVKLILVNFN